MKKTKVLSLILSLLFILTISCAQMTKAQSENFSFYHMSDSHLSPAYKVPDDLSKERSYSTISKLKTYEDILLEPYNVTAPKASFYIHTGDLAEFGYPGATWDVFAKYFEGNKTPFYLAFGNHDVTQVANTEEAKKRFGGINYSFEHGGIHFIALCTPSLQEPVPTITEETLAFLRQDLTKIDKSKPVIVFFHHPLDTNEFCSDYEVDRLLDTLRENNIVLMLDGHGHSPVKHNFAGIDGIEGGSTYSKDEPGGGFNVVYVKDGKIYAAYKKDSEPAAKKGLIEKVIPAKSNYPAITISSPASASVLAGDSLDITAGISGNEKPITKATYSIDNEKEGALEFAAGTAKGKIDIKDLANGAHFLRVKFEYAEKEAYQKSTFFYIENKAAQGMASAKWRFQAAGSWRTTPLVMFDIVVAGCNDGNLYALDKETGALKWKFNAGSEILSSPALFINKTERRGIIFGTGSGKVFSVAKTGEKIWEYNAGAAVYSSPVISSDGTVYFANNKSEMFALDAATGKEIWKKSYAQFSIESKPAIGEGKVVFGSWDGYIYCLDAKTGEQIWKKPGPKNQTRVITYYGPADNGPVISEGKVIITDRGYICGIYDLKTGNYIKEIAKECSGISLSADGKAIYQRKLDKTFDKVNLEGNSIWSVDLKLGRLPISPTESLTNVFVCSNNGRLYSLNKDSGAKNWEYQVTPKLFVMGGVAAEKGIAYVGGLDGVLTAIEKK